MILGKNKDLSITIESCLILYPKIKQHRNIEYTRMLESPWKCTYIQNNKSGNPIKYNSYGI